MAENLVSQNAEPCYGSFGSSGVYVETHVESIPRCTVPLNGKALHYVTVTSYMGDAMVVKINAGDKAEALLFGDAELWDEEIEVPPPVGRKAESQRTVAVQLTRRSPLPRPTPPRAQVRLEAEVGVRHGLSETLGDRTLMLELPTVPDRDRSTAPPL